MPAPDLDAFKYLGFEDAFRGSQDEIRRRLEEYVPLFAGQSDVLDIGCGRGEFLDLLRARGIRARGLDLNHEMVEESRRAAWTSPRATRSATCSGLPDASLGGLFAAQVVEHLAAGLPDAPARNRVAQDAARRRDRARDDQPGVLAGLLRKLHPRPDARAPAAPGDAAVSPQGQRLHRCVDRVQGADSAVRSAAMVPPPPADAPPYVVDLVETFNDNMGKLNARMFTFQDYAAIGHKRHA